jgi:enoyl-CoA hydratase/carnithine racemase
MGEAPELIYAVADGIGLVTFNRPQARNALTFGMYDRLAEICSGITLGGPVKVLILTGAGGKAFAAGTDIAQFRDFKDPQKGIDYEVHADEIFTAIETCPVPTIAAISGACTGGGAGIAACCDLRIASRDMKFGFPIARTLGNVLAAATLSRLVALVGQARVVDMIFTTRLIEAEEARAIGLINDVGTDHADVMARARALAEKLKGHAPLTMRYTKELLRRLRTEPGPIDDRAIMGMIYTSHDFHEGLDAFLAKRTPNWKAR